MDPRNASTLALIVAASLIAGSGWAAAQGMNETEGNETNGVGAPAAGGNETGPQGAEDDGPAGFMEAGGRLIGDHVSFAFDAESGTVCDWTFEDALVIEGIAWAEFRGDADVRGSEVAIRDSGAAGGADNGTGGTGGSGAGNETGNETDGGPGGNETGNATTEGDCPGDITPPQSAGGEGSGARQENETGLGPGGRSAMKLHDTPNGFIKTELRENETVQWTFAANLTVSLEGPERVRIQGQGLEAILFKDRGDPQDPQGRPQPRPQPGSGFQVSGNQVTLSGSQENVMFRVSIVETPEDQAINQAVAEGDVAAEIAILSGEDQVIADFDEVELVDVQIEEARIVIDIRVEAPTQEPPPSGGGGAGGNGTGNGTGGNEPDGNETADGTGAGEAPVTVLVIDLDVTQVTNVKDVEIRIDDATLEQASDVDDVLAMDEATQEAFLAVDAEGSARLVVSVATGSHSLSVASASGEPIVAQEHVTDVAGEEPAPEDGGGEIPTAPTGPAPGGFNESDRDTPALGSVAALLAVLGVALLARRRRE